MLLGEPSLKKLLAANWKMFKTTAEAQDTLTSLLALTPPMPPDREFVLFAPYTALHTCAGILARHPGFAVGSQNVYPAAEGAFTGEISPKMLLDAGCAYVLTGHSERRVVLHESSGFIGKKTAFALVQGLHVVLCIGETLSEREQGKLEAVLAEQLELGLAEVPDDVSPGRLAVAYEPVWAIGTGKVAGPREILDVHAVVRRLLLARFPAQGAFVRILYGGSVNPGNTKQILALDNVGGVLVGGASLEAKSMHAIMLS